MKILIALVCVLGLIGAAPLTKDKVVMAIDCGASAPYKSAEGFIYTAV